MDDQSKNSRDTFWSMPDLTSLARGDLLLEGYTPEEIILDSSLIERRVAQQELVRSTPGIVRLDRPGTQKDNYKFDEDGSLKHLYYASYGSNLFIDRFLTYIEGGQPEGSAKSYTGCRDKTLPVENIPVALNGTIHYAGDSGVWTGGVAFLDTSTSGKSLGRAYLITPGQFEDIVAQECGDEVGTKNILFHEVITHGILEGSGLYGTLVHVGDYNSAPVLTFTAAFTTKQSRSRCYAVEPHGKLVLKSHALSPNGDQGKGANTENHWDIFPNTPSDMYRHKITAGLKETHGLTLKQTEIYLNGSTGVMPS